MRTGIIALVVVLAAASLAASKSPSPTSNLSYGHMGVDLTTRDTGVRPGDDFDRYAGGAWSDRTPIAADANTAGPYDDLEELSQRRIAAIVAGSAPASRISSLYRSFVDEARVEALGAGPISSALTAIDQASDRIALAQWLGESRSGFGLRPFEIGVGSALDNPNVAQFDVGQSGIGLPDRDYYLLDRFDPQRTAYRTYITTLLALSGTDAAQAQTEADAVLAFETKIAQVHYSRADARNPKNLKTETMADLTQAAPDFPWTVFLKASGLPTAAGTLLVVAQDRAVSEISTLYANTSLPTLKAWARFHLLDDAAPYLSSAFADASFDFRKTLNGVAEQESREKRGVKLVDSLLGDEVGKAYVERYFTPADRLGAQKVVDNVKTALRQRLAANEWLSPQARATALQKLDNYTVMLGWPDTWRDYSALKLRSDDLFGNMVRIRADDWAFERSLLDHKVDRGRWIVSPQTVNAYNGGQELKIVLPAARLQPPYYSRFNDPAVNYGALGALAGHELSHSFDNRGRLVDPAGRLRDWWSPQDVEAFEARTAVLGAQYETYEPVPGVHLNGKLTMGENIADLVGLLAALDAYHTSLNGKPAPVIDGTTGDQRFFLAYAQTRREKQREEDLRDKATRDPHAPGRYRVLGPLRNIDAWYAAFHVMPGDKYYLPTDKRVRIW